MRNKYSSIVANYKHKVNGEDKEMVGKAGDNQLLEIVMTQVKLGVVN